MNPHDQIKPVDILLIEDSAGDVRLIQESLADGKLLNRLNVVNDGQEALNYLHRKNQWAKAQRPDIILLDLNLPKVDGREVLRQIKSDPELKTIPVVVLTTSQAEEDILKSYDLHANCYVTKPVDLDEFIDAVRKIENFWLTLVRLPPKSG